MKRKNAFTLVELLVVITIIGILASLITVAVGGVRKAAKRTRIVMELSQLTLALEQYKSQFGEYPPDLSDVTAVSRHIRKRWPRFVLASTAVGASVEEKQYVAFMTAISHFYRGDRRIVLLNSFDFSASATTKFMDDTDSQDYSKLQHDPVYLASLPIWLGGFPNEDGIFKGFSSDPTAPFGRFIDPANNNNVAINNGRPIADYYSGCSYDHLSIGQQDEKSVVLEMRIAGNVSFAKSKNDAVFPYFANELRSDLKVPYVYFNAKGTGDTTYARLKNNSTTDFIVAYYNFGAFFTNDPVWSELGAVAPYAKSGDPFVSGKTMWYEPSRYQLIHPGLDGKFGTKETTDNSDNEADFTYTIAATVAPNQQALIVRHFRSLNTDADKNTIGQDDMDNITNFTESIKSLVE